MQYGLTIATEPAAEPLTAAEVREYGRIPTDEDGRVITRQITAGRRLAERRTRRAFVNTTFDLWLSEWPAHGRIILPKPPTSSVSYVKYRDADGTWQTVSSSVYELDATDEPSCIVEAYNQSWPAVFRRRKAINVRYVAGYGSTAASVPADIREAIAAYVLSLYDDRGIHSVGAVGELPFSARHLLDPYIVRDFMLTQGG